MHWAETFCHKWFCKNSAKVWHEPAPCMRLDQHQSCELQHQAPELCVLFVPQHQICLPKVAPEHLHSTIRCYNTMLHHFLSLHQGKPDHLRGSCSVFGIPASTPLAQWPMPSMADYSFVLNHHCWAVKIWISLSLDRVPFQIVFETI